MKRLAAICGSQRTGSYNRLLLQAMTERTPEGLEIVEVDIRDFPLFNQDLEATPPPAVGEAKRLIAACDCLLMVSPEYCYGVPGYLKNAIDWLSRPYQDPTLIGKPMALCGASGGYMGTLRSQLHWRQSWYYFRAPVFSDAELTVAFGAKAFDAEGRLVNEQYDKTIRDFLGKLLDWLTRDCPPPR